ncbi:unnamed protein product [Danaus chrysippus]|uniref:(African queen) hypothetical protein n=1 Tax=Danaus chrysippus TaxID=151541 RepID=A0A8J2QUK6_9NEOP|nr:unnamed protein product [Danaus chrysippus]
MNFKYFMVNDEQKMDHRNKRNINIFANNIPVKKNNKDEYQLLNDTKDLLEEDLKDKNKIFANRSDVVNEYIETFTEEPCVGDPEFCNMTKEEYLEMLYEYIYPKSYEWVLIATHAIVFVTGLIGNALVCIAVYRNHTMRTVTNYFIVNLAVADFLVILFCLPPTVLWDVTKTWFFGTAICRIVLYFQSVSVTVSVLTLTFISLDRWYAICYPLKFKSTTNRAKTAILIIWMLSLLFNIPEFVILEVQANIELRFNQQYFMQCTYTWSEESELTWHIIRALFLYTFPLMLMMVAYCQIVRVLWRSDNIPGHRELHQLCPNGQTNGFAARRRRTASIHANASTEGQLRSRRKAAKMLVAVVIMFAVCFFPVHLLCVLRVAYNVQHSDMMTAVALISHVMCYVNSAVNPLIYNFMSGKFRHEFYRSYCKCFRCYTPPDDITLPGSSRSCNKRTTIRRNDTCLGYRQSHHASSNHNSVHRDLGKMNTSFIENMNGNRRLRNNGCDNSISESARFTLNSEARD